MSQQPIRRYQSRGPTKRKFPFMDLKSEVPEACKQFPRCRMIETYSPPSLFLLPSFAWTSIESGTHLYDWETTGKDRIGRLYLVWRWWTSTGEERLSMPGSFLVQMRHFITGESGVKAHYFACMNDPKREWPERLNKLWDSGLQRYPTTRLTSAQWGEWGAVPAKKGSDSSGSSMYR